MTDTTKPKPAPTDETQGVKREVVVRQTPESFSGRFVGMTPHAQGQWVAYADHLSQLEAVERERDSYRTLSLEHFASKTAVERELKTAEASLAAMREALDEIDAICTESASACRKRMGTRVGNILAVCRAALAAGGNERWDIPLMVMEE